MLHLRPKHDLNDDRRIELCAFLKDARSRLRPADVGIDAIGRRRVPGLRRDEVAVLCNVSVAWYTWFETGRKNTRPSPNFIAAVARALRFDADQTRYLFSLAIIEMPRIAPPIADFLERTLLSIASGLVSNPNAIERQFDVCERSPVGVYCTSFDGSIHYANEALVKLMGYPSKDEYRALNVARDLYDEADERYLWQDEIAQAGLLKNVVTAARDASGNRVYIRDSAIAVHRHDQDECRYIGIWQRA